MAGPRLFDHEEAVRRRQAGESFAQIAASLGVTAEAVSQAVKRATDPNWAERSRKHSRDYQRDTLRVPCLGCGGVAWKARGKRSEKASGLCPRCYGESVRQTVREGELRCSECKEWKPDREFPKGRNHAYRRFRHAVCRGCQAEVKRRSRAALSVPCAECGTPCLSPSERRRPERPPLCRDCYLKSIRHG